jgi:hypothetical protein
MATDTNTQPACELIGHEGEFRLPGGRRVYDGVVYNDATARSNRVRLAYLKSTPEGLHQVNRWVDWDQPVEVIKDHTADYEAQKQAEYEADSAS